MKPEELMIGDIVDIHRCECVADGGQIQEWDEYGKVVSITENYITVKYIGREEDYGSEDVNEEDISPIPLTPEILEKNGFVKQAYDGWLISENDGRRLIEYRTDYFDGMLRINYAEEPFSKLTIKVKYFHELQHALRLCGVEKRLNYEDPKMHQV